MKTHFTQSYLLLERLPQRKYIGIFTLLLTLISQLAVSQVRNIDRSTNFSTIQAAIDDAATVSGDVIEVDAGTYTENVTVNKSVTIKGANFGTAGCGTRVTESIVAGGTGTAFTVSANDVTIDGFNVTGVTGIASTGVGGMKFKNNLITAGVVGINITNVSPSPLYIAQIQENCINLTTQVVGSTTTIGIFLNGFPPSPSPTLISNNSISGGFYGYLVHNFNSGLFGSISNGSITGCMQGIAVVNTLNGTNLFPSNIAIQGVSMSSFTGNHPTLPSQNFSAGIYTFTTGATTPSNGITLTVNNVTINGTTSLSASGAGIYLGDFSTGGPSVQSITVTGSNILNNANRGIDARGRVTVDVNTSTFTNNGNAAFGTDGNDGFTILAQRGAIVTASNNTIVHPAISTTPVTAFSTGNTPANTINASNNSISMNGNANAKGANNSGGNTITATCNWWGVTGANVAPLMSGVVSFETFLSSGTDSDGAAGFQPAAGTCNGCSSGNSITNTTTGKSFCTIQSAIDDATTLDNHVIAVSDGTYAENLVINKALTLRGPNGAISPNGGSRLAEAIITGKIDIANDATRNITVEGFQFQGVVSPLNYNGNSSNSVVLDVIFRKNRVVGSSGQLAVFTGTATNTANATIEDNFFQAMSGNAMQLNSGAGGITTAQIINNTISGAVTAGLNLGGLTNSNITGNVINNTGQQGIQIADASANVTIANNVISNTNTSADVNRGGIRIRGMAFTGPVNITNNIVSGSLNGIIIPPGENITGKTINVTNNKLDGNSAFAIKNAGTGTLNATCNWYGGITGTVAPLISGAVTFEQFLTSGTDDAPTTVGFQPVAGTCNGCSSGNSITNTTTGKSFCTIQAAINDAATNNGDIIIVGAGTYAENIIVSKSLDIRGPNYNVSPNGGSRVAEAIIVPATNAVVTGEIIHISASNVKINGFTIDGDNTLLTGGANNTNGVDMNAAEGVTVYEDNINNLTVSNNIFQNLSYFGVTLYGASFSSPASSGHVVSNNKFQNLGTYTDGTNQVNFWGGGVLLYNNQYAAISDNVMTNVRLGVQSGNFSRANPGTVASQIISGNTMQVRRVGVFHNLHYSLTSPYTFSNNTITGLANANETGVRGFLLGSLSVNSTLTNNNVDLTGVSVTTTGIEVWNVKNTTPSIISGGTISGINTGIFINNFDGYNSDATDGSYATLSGMTITPNAAGTGIRVYDNPSSTHVGVQATIGAGITVNNGTTGISVENASAQIVSPTGNIAFVGQTGDYIKLVNNANNINAVAASFDGKMGNAMTAPERLALEGKLLHKPDNAALGLVTYFDPVHNLTQNTYHATIQAAITAANANDVLELAEATYNERVIVSKSLTIQGVNKANCIVSGTGLSGTGSGFYINNGVTGVTIKDLTIQNFAGGGPNANAGVYAIGGNNNLTVKNTIIKDNAGGSGIYANGPINTVLFDGNSISGHTNVQGVARGIVIWNGLKENITITNNEVFNNNCCGIELQEGSATNVNISTNNVHDNGDSGMGLIGLTGPGANTVSNNIVANNGRFGIEIKNPSGSGAASGAGSVVISGNTVSRTNPIGSEVRDIAGIAVFRRSVLSGNVDVPYGTVVSGNTVSGYTQPSNSDGFGIVVEGINHTVSGNTVSGNDVGIQRQAGHLPYPADGDQTNVVDTYFGRGNSPVSCGIILTANTLSTNTIDTRDVGNSDGQGIVVNTNTSKSFCSIQTAINDVATINGHTITVSSGTFNEQVVVNKELIIKGIGASKPIINFTGTVTGKPALIDISAKAVTIDNFNLKVDFTKLSSGIIASGADLDNTVIKNNLIEATASSGAASFGTYGDRNAVSVNYVGSTNYRTAVGGVDLFTFQNNTVSGVLNDGFGVARFFRSGISADEIGGLFSGNTLQSINHDILIRFAGNGNVTISSNNFNGGGLELAEFNAGAGNTSVSNNSFDATFANVAAAGAAVLRLKNNQQNKVFNITGNNFTNHQWAASLENFKNVTLGNNTFTPLANSTTYQHIVINTKSLSSNSNTIVQTAVGATLINNTFNGSGTLGGTALNFLNHDSDNATFGTFNIGASGNENTFNSGIAKFIALDTQTGSTNSSTFPTYATSGGWPTIMACWSTNLDVKNNFFDVGSGANLPSIMTFEQRNTLETLLHHKPDASCAGKLEYYLPVQNVTQNTFFADIQPAIAAAAANDIIELSEWTFAEGITIDKPLTIQGLDSANVVLDGASIADANGITLANGIQNIIIKKLKIKNFKGSSSLGSGIFGIQNSNLMIDEVVLDNNQGRGGVYLGASGGIQNVTIKNSISKNHGVLNSRGIVIWDGYKQNITIQNNKVYGNNCCGIELQDGTASGVTISGNFVVANVDNGFGLTGLKGGIGANIIENNIIRNNGRFGIEIKNPNGNGLETGDGSIVVRNNTVSLAASPTMNNRDHAGIAVFRRGFLVNNTENYANIPTGVVVKDNEVSGYKQLNPTSTESKGYGIVIEGTNHKVIGNTVDDNDVNIQEQGGGHNAPNYVDSNSGDGDQDDGQSPNYFGRGNSPVACSNTFSGNGTLANERVNNTSVTGPNSFAMVVNTTTRETFCSIQAAINDPQTLNGHTLEVSSGAFNEQVLVNKEVIIKGIGSPKPIVNFTGTPALASGKLTAFEITVPNVTVDNLEFKVDISKIGSAIVASVALPGSVSNLKIQNNAINPYRSSATTVAFGSRNAVNINYGAFRVDVSNPTGILAQNNTISYSNGVDNTAGNADDAGFRAGFAMDEGTGDFTANTIQTISQDIEIRFTNTTNNINITNNNINGGGVNFAAPNVTGGTLTISGNTFNGTFGSTYSSLLRLRDNIAPNFINTVVQNNTFSNHTWGISLENYNNVTVNNNTFTPLANSINYHHITVNTKENASSSATVAQTPIGGVFTNNTFNGSGTTGGTAMKFLNQDSDNAAFGTITLGSASNENTFNAGIANFIALDSQTGSSNGSTFPVYPTTGDWPTTMACWNQNINIENNKFDVGAGLQLPSAMNFTNRTAFEAALTHKPDNNCLGSLIYFYPVKNLTQNTTFLTIQPAIAAAAANDVIELSEWTFAEGITIDKPLTIQGVDSANVVLDGASIANANGITLANGVQNIIIKKLKIKNFKGSSTLGSGIFGLGGNSNLTIDEIVLDNNQGRGGIYIGAVSGIQNVTISNSISKNNSVAGSRGIVIWDGFKQNITITGNKVYNNNCCGIELQDGTASGVTITDNIIFGNVDNGLGLTGLMQGAGANLIKNNTIINNGRFGIEIKLPNGTGATSGDGSIVVEDNTVQQSTAFNILRPSEVRDIAGIAVFRRGYVASYGNVDIPKGVVVRNNTISGFTQNNPSSSSTGFGIVIEGTDHTVTGNTLNNNNVGIQQQSGHLPYTANTGTDGDQTNLADLYFGRGNSPLICNNVISSNIFSGNTIIDARNIRNGAVVTEDITPTVDAVASQVVCNGSSSTLVSFTGNTITGKTYSWTNSTPSIGLAASGSGDISAFTVTNTTTVAVTATITVTPMANGCSGTPTTFTITVNPSPTVTASSNAPQCVGSTLNLSATGGTGYSWNGPNSFTSSLAMPSISSTTNANAGTYTVTVTDANGCTATATTAVTFNQLPTASIVSNSPICSGGNVTFTLTTNGTSYVWSGPNSFSSTDQNPSIAAATVANSGTYTVVVMSAEGCSSTATTSVTVNPLPNATAGSNTPQCVGGTLSLTSNNGTSYAWLGPNSFSSTDQNPSILSVTNAANGTYSVTVTDANGCSATATTAVTINPKPAKPTILPSSATICEGGNVILVVICPGNTVNWSNGASGSSINVSPAGTTTYTATCTNSFGCVSDPSDPATVNIVAKPAKPVITPSITTICAGSSATLTATACTNGTFTWSDGTTSTSNTLIVSPSTNQSYTVTCTSIFGCVSLASDPIDVIVNPIPTAPTVANILISSGASASLTATCATGTPVWYSSSTATTSVGVGNYITPALLVNTSYFVACETSPGGTSTTNPQNCVSSRVQQVVTIDLFAIVSHPADIYVCGGQNASFTVGATGASITYQWQENTGSGWNNLSNGGVYSGVNATTLFIAQSPTTLDGYQYRCVITNTKPDALAPLTLESNPAIFVVKGSALANNLIIVSPLANIANLYQAVQTITATNKISGTSKIDYFAGNSITLNPGFEVSAGSVFKAKIQLPCINTSSPIPDTLKK